MLRFPELFAGRTDVYGTYFVKEERHDGKQKGHGKTMREPITDEVWTAHLDGTKMLGVVPIRLDGTVAWFAGDIDKYSIDLPDLERKCQALNIPAVICRSKSGGAHMYVFVNGTAPASLARKAMAKWLKQLGHEKCEIFPKQDEVTEETTGNWINLPYYGGDKTDRYAFGINGERLSLAEFEQLANARAIPAKELEQLVGAKSPKQDKGPYADAPPCVERIFTESQQEGGRNNTLTQIAIYFQKADPDNWKDQATAANYRVFSDPLPMEEVNHILRSVSKGKYEYMCKVEPMCSLCDKDKCLKRKWGVGPQQGIDYADGEIDRIVKITSDPPIFHVIINGKKVPMNTDQLLSPRLFRKRVYEMTGMLIQNRKDKDHERAITTARMDVEEAPMEVSTEGAVHEVFEAWCEANVPMAQELDDVSRGYPFYDAARKRIIFRSQDLIFAMRRNRRLGTISDRDVWAALRDLGCTQSAERIARKTTKVWMFPVERPWFQIHGKEDF
jgi:hypothetical protein